MRPAITAGGIHNDANRRGIVSSFNEPKPNHNTTNKTIAKTAKITPTTLALVRLRRFTGEGEFVILSPNDSFLIISKVDTQYRVEVGRKRQATSCKHQARFNGLTLVEIYPLQWRAGNRFNAAELTLVKGG
jgi:hypothetical protein